MLLLFDGMWWYPQLTASGKHRLSFVWDFNALSLLAKSRKEGFIFVVEIHDFQFKNIRISEFTLKNLHDFLEGNSMKVLTRYLRFLTTKVFHSLGAWIMGNGKLSRREYFQFFNKIKWWGSADHDQMPLELFVDNAKQQWRNMTKNRARKRQQRCSSDRIWDTVHTLLWFQRKQFWEHKLWKSSFGSNRRIWHH